MKSNSSFPAFRILTICWLLCLSLLSGCQILTPDMSTNEEAAIYTAVIRQIYEYDDTYGGSLRPPVVYVIQTTDDSVGDPDVQGTKATRLNESVVTLISANLNDLPADFIWVDDADEVPVDAQSGSIANGGVMITLGNLHKQANGSVHVSGSIFIAPLAAGGQTYVVKQVDGVWKIVGTTGVRWIS